MAVGRKRRECAIQLRDLAVAIVRHRGSWYSWAGKRGNEFRSLQYRADELCIAYRTPFQPPPSVPDYIKYMAAAYDLGAPRNLPYGIDVWSPRKVLNIEWEDGGEIRVVSYRPGQWEEHIRC